MHEAAFSAARGHGPEPRMRIDEEPSYSDESHYFIDDHLTTEQVASLICLPSLLDRTERYLDSSNGTGNEERRTAEVL